MADRMVLLPAAGRRRKRRLGEKMSRVAWIAGGILVAGLAALAIDEAGWVRDLVDGPDPGLEAAEPAARALGPGNLGLPAPDNRPPPPPPP